MISWRALLDGAQPLTVGPVNDEFLERSIVRLRGVKRRVPGPRGFRYPGHVDQMTQVRRVLEDVATQSPAEAQLLAELLRHPARVYPLANSSGAFALLGAWRVDDAIEPRIAIVSTAGETAIVDIGTYGVGETQDELLATMERLYVDIDGGARQASDPTRGPTDRVLWIGGSDAEAADPMWRTRVEAALMTEGFVTVIHELPGRAPVEAARAVSESTAAAVVAWVPRLGNPGLADEIRSRAASRLIELTEYPFEDALAELRLTLEVAPLVAPDPKDEDATAGVFQTGGPYYFKKVAKRGRGVDLVVHRRDPCSHDAWTVAHGAPQARKGIERHAGRSIRKLEHCDRCTGGGMWRVTFD